MAESKNIVPVYYERAERWHGYGILSCIVRRQKAYTFKVEAGTSRALDDGIICVDAGGYRYPVAADALGGFEVVAERGVVPELSLGDGAPENMRLMRD